MIQCVDSSTWEISHQPIEHQELEGAMLQGSPLSFRRPGGGMAGLSGRQFECGPKWKVRSFPKSQMGARSSWEAGIM